MRRPGLRWEVSLVGAVAMVLLGVYFFGPWLTGERGIVAGTPAGFPRAQSAEVDVARGKVACLAPIGIPTDADRAVFGLKPGGEVRVELSGPGYRFAAPARGVAEGQASVQMTPPRRDVLGRACFRNTGRRTATLTATGEIRGISLQSATTVDGQANPVDLSLRFDESRPKSVLDHASDGFARLALWKPGIAGVPLLWLVAVLVAVAVPAAVLWAFASSVRALDELD